MTRPKHAPLVQTLEARRLLAASIVDRVLMIQGTDLHDYVRVEVTPGELTVHTWSNDAVNPTTHAFMLADFDTIRVKTGGGKDDIEFYNASVPPRSLNLTQPLYIHSGGGNDRVLISPGIFVTNIHIFGGGGNDRIHLPWRDWGAEAGLSLRTFVYGDGGDDHIRVDSGMLRAWGGSGNDSIFGGPQTDILYGDGGDDVIDAGRGNATVHGGTGNDDIRARQGILDLRGGHGRDALYAYGPNSLHMYGGADDDELRVSGHLWGTTLLDGGTGHDRLNASMAIGNGVSLIGGGSGDTLIGSPHNDNFYGQGGHDWIYRMGGTDYIDPDDDMHVI